MSEDLEHELKAMKVIAGALEGLPDDRTRQRVLRWALDKFAEGSGEKQDKLQFLKKYYYDTAASGNWVMMQNLKQIVGTSQVVLGDDHPYGEPLTYVKQLKELANDGTLTVDEVNAILRDNMLRFMPQLKSYQAATT